MEGFVPFDDKKLLVRVQDGGRVLFALPDVARAIGLEPNTIRHLIQRNLDLFSPFIAFVKNGELGDVTSPNSTAWNEEGRPVSYFLDQDAIIAVCIKVCPSRVADPVARQRIVRFQTWAVRAISAILRSQVAIIYRGEAPLGWEDVVAAIPGERTAAMRKAALEQRVSLATAYYRRKKACMARPKKPSPGPGASQPQERIEIVKLLNQGKTPKEIRKMRPWAMQRATFYRLCAWHRKETQQ
jgi:hypothetical protein